MKICPHDKRNRISQLVPILPQEGFHIGCKYLLTLKEIGFEISHFTAGHNYDDHGFTAMKGLNLACR